MSALICLSMAVYFEARSEPIEGQLAVAQVIMNRVEHDAWPDTVCDVVTEHRGEYYVTCQFSFWCDYKPEHIEEHRAWVRSMAVGALVLNEQHWSPEFYGLYHYHSVNVRPEWAKELKVRMRIGDHVFYGR